MHARTSHVLSALIRPTGRLTVHPTTAYRQELINMVFTRSSVWAIFSIWSRWIHAHLRFGIAMRAEQPVWVSIWRRKSYSSHIPVIFLVIKIGINWQRWVLKWGKIGVNYFELKQKWLERLNSVFQSLSDSLRVKAAERFFTFLAPILTLLWLYFN